VVVQVGGGLGHAGVVGGQHRPAGRRVTEAVEDRDALGGAQDHVKGWHRVAAVGAAEEFAGVGVAALEPLLEARRRCFALQSEAGGVGTVPPSWGLAVARQVLLVVVGQLAEVVVLPAHRQLGHVRYHPAASSSPSLARANAPWCIALIRLIRVERRANGDASSVMAVARMAGCGDGRGWEQYMARQLRTPAATGFEER
jgi:hypothetical protein